MHRFRACYNIFMFRRRIRLAQIVALLITSSPTLALAAGIPTIVSCTDTMCGICDVAKTAQNVLNAGIFLGIFFSAGAFAWAGWIHVTAGGDAGKVKEAN